MKSYESVVKRIKKLLALSQDVSSPHEAAIAATRVNKLMAEYNIDMADLIRHELENDDNIVEVDFENKKSATFDLWIQSLAVTIAKSLGCDTRFLSDSTYRKKLVFQGFEPDVIVANWLLGYCYETIERLAAIALKTRPYNPSQNGRSYANAFKSGAASEVAIHIKEVYREEITTHPTNGKDLAIVKHELIARKFGVASYRRGKRKVSDNDAYSQGVEAGKSISIQKVVGSDVSPKISGYLDNI